MIKCDLCDRDVTSIFDIAKCIKCDKRVCNECLPHTDKCDKTMEVIRHG